MLGAQLAGFAGGVEPGRLLPSRLSASDCRTQGKFKGVLREGPGEQTWLQTRLGAEQLIGRQGAQELAGQKDRTQGSSCR